MSVKDGPGREAAAGSNEDHEEWLLDESLAETFPASDPIAPALPPDDGVSRLAGRSGAA
jgi:hypothetical protein